MKKGFDVRKLITGIRHFQSHIVSSRKEFFESLAHGQSPEALFITCSDSRISPNEITQTEPGELFIIRNAGNIVPPHGASSGGEGATIEYAVSVLGVKHIIVCGHSHCGAMKGLLNPEGLAHLPAVSAWLHHAEATRRIVRENYADLQGESQLTAAIAENVLVQIENLRTLPSVAARLARGDLSLHAWIYQIETGDVYTYDAKSGRFSPIEGEDLVPVVTRTRGVAEGVLEAKA